jgi:hypothetical protein
MSETISFDPDFKPERADTEISKERLREIIAVMSDAIFKSRQDLEIGAIGDVTERDMEAKRRKLAAMEKDLRKYENILKESESQDR